MLKKIISTLLVFTTISFFAQKKFTVSGDVFGRRNFIQNNGQFDKVLKSAEIVKYAYINGDEGVYFHDKGLVYHLQKHFPITEHQKEEMEHGKKINPKPSENYFINVTWENANPNMQLVVTEKQSFYHSFGNAEYKSDCFKKLTFKNVYNNIDIEYTFTDERMDGLKYNVILHPGANINDIKFKYTGDVNDVKTKNQKLIIKSPYLSVTELAPKAFQANKSVDCEFKVENGIMTFVTPKGYNNNEQLVIDPWITNLALATNNYAYDVDHDYVGNFFVYGGSGPFLISKYNTAGVLQWTFGGTVPVAGWTSLGSLPANKYAGNFMTEKASGKCYTGEGFNMTIGTRMVRIDQNGLYDNFVSTAVAAWNELWDMSYYCLNGTVFGIGGSIAAAPAGAISAGILNTTNGSIVVQNFSGITTTSSQDIVSNAIDPQGNVFFVFASFSSAGLNNRLMRANAAFNGNVWIAPTTYNTFNESDNKFYPGAGMPGNYSNGYNALAANTSYLFYYDGSNLAAYSKATGAKLGQIVVPGLTVLQQGGIVADDCNNVYIGGNGSILSYFFNGAAFVTLPSIPLGVPNVNKYVTDIKYNISTNELYVSGTGFGGVYSAVNSITCTSIGVTVTPVCVGNNNGSALTTASTNIINPSYNYSVANSTGSYVATGGSTPSNTYLATGLANGNYTMFVQVNAPCGPIKTTTFNINCVCSVTAAASSSCTTNGISTSLSLSATTGFTPAPTSFTWTGPGGFNASVSNTVFGTAVPGIYTLSASNPSCVGTGTVNVTIPSIFTINLTGTNIACYNGTSGAALVSSITGTSTAPYTYTWSTNPAQTNSLASNIAAGTYSCFVTDALGCTYSKTITLTQPPSLTLSINTNTTSVCVGNNITFTATGSGGSGAGYTYSWTPTGALTSNITSSQPVGGEYTYTATVTDGNGCNLSAIKTVTFINNPVLTTLDKSYCRGLSANLSVNGASSYTWSPNLALTNINGSSTIANPSVTTIYTIQGSNAMCTGSTTVLVTVVEYPDMQLSSPNQQVCIGDRTSITALGASFYEWQPNNAIQGSSTNNSIIASPVANTEYTVIGINSVLGTTCSVKKMMTVLVVPQVTPVVTQNKIICEGEKVTLGAGGGNVFLWKPATALNSTTNSAVVSTPSASIVYTVDVSNNGFCGNTATVGIIVNPNPKVNAGRDSIYNSDEQIFLNASGTGVMKWLVGDGIICYDCPNTQIIAKSGGCYVIESVNEFNCKAKDEVCITITNESDIYIPNAFTPNNDGLNDVFLAKAYAISDFKMEVFNRWGELLFTSSDITKGWDGTYKGKQVEVGSYVYKCKYKGLDGKIKDKIGHVTLNK